MGDGGGLGVGIQRSGAEQDAGEELSHDIGFPSSIKKVVSLHTDCGFMPDEWPMLLCWRKITIETAAQDAHKRNLSSKNTTQF